MEAEEHIDDPRHQASGRALSLCGQGDAEGNITVHIMVACPKLEPERVNAKLFSPTHPRPDATWEVWLAKDEQERTQDFVARLASKWAARGGWPPDLVPAGRGPWREGQCGVSTVEGGDGFRVAFPFFPFFSLSPSFLFLCTGEGPRGDGRGGGGPAVGTSV